MVPDVFMYVCTGGIDAGSISSTLVHKQSNSPVGECRCLFARAFWPKIERNKEKMEILVGN